MQRPPLFHLIAPYRFATYGTFIMEMGNLRWLYHPHSRNPFSFSWDYVKDRASVQFEALTSWDLFLRDLKTFPILFLAKEAEKWISSLIRERIGPQMKHSYSPHELKLMAIGSNGSLDRLVPTPTTLFYDSISVVAARFIIYPICTIAIRYNTGMITYADIPSLFNNVSTFASLYNGIGYHLLWTLFYQGTLSVYQMGYFKLVIEPSKDSMESIWLRFAQYGFGVRLPFSILSTLVSPLLTKSLFDQAHPGEYPMEWDLSLPRYICTMTCRLFNFRSGRDKHVKSLKMRYPHAIEKSKGTVYELPVGQQYTMRVVLPTNFPKDLPHLQILPPTLKSQFVDLTGKVLPLAHASLGNWNNQTPLGDIVADVIELLGSETSSSSSVKRYPHMGSYGSGNASQGPIVNIPEPTRPAPSTPALNTTNPSPSPYYSSNSFPQSTPPERKQNKSNISSSFPEVNHLSPQQIQQLLDNPSSFEDFFQETSCVRMLESARDESRKKNMERAQKNLEKERELQQEKQKLEEIMQQYAALRAQYEQLSTEQAKLMGQYAPSVIRGKLSRAVEMAEERSEEVVTAYSNGEISTNAFLDQYLQERKVYHQRKAKLECLQ